MTAEAGWLGRGCLHGRCCGHYGVLLGALLATTLFALRFGRCSYRTVRGLRTLLADAKNDNHTADDKDNSDTAANNKRQVSWIKYSTSSGTEWGILDL